MTENKFMLISLDDERSKSVAEVLSSATCKKIINHLAENKEASQKDISDAVGIPLNTVEYNINKLLNSGFIQKRKNFFWSKKGKKIVMYELSNKSIIISHKKKVSDKVKSIVPAFILTAVGTFSIWVYEKIKLASNIVTSVNGGVSEESSGVILDASKASDVITPETILTPMQTPLWAWFLLGSLIAIFIISIVNWRKL